MAPFWEFVVLTTALGFSKIRHVLTFHEIIKGVLHYALYPICHTSMPRHLMFPFFLLISVKPVAL